MARSKKQLIFTPPGWRQALKARFLDFGFRHNPEALRHLATEVRGGAITPRQWANRFGVAETWVEQWVEDVLGAWRTQPYLIPELDQLSDTKPPVTIRYPPPRDERTPADVFLFSISTVPTSKLSLGILMGGSVEDDEPDDDRLRFRKQMHDLLDVSLDQYQKNATRPGSSREVLLPDDLLEKTEVTAAYFFCRLSPEKLLPLLAQRVGDRTTIYRWIKEIAKLLEIPVRRRRD